MYPPPCSCYEGENNSRGNRSDPCPYPSSCVSDCPTSPFPLLPGPPCNQLPYPLPFAPSCLCLTSTTCPLCLPLPSYLLVQLCSGSGAVSSSRGPSLVTSQPGQGKGVAPSGWDVSGLEGPAWKQKVVGGGGDGRGKKGQAV